MSKLTYAGGLSYFIVMDELLSLFNFDLEIFNINGFFFFGSPGYKIGGGGERHKMLLKIHFYHCFSNGKW